MTTHQPGHVSCTAGFGNHVVLTTRLLGQDWHESGPPLKLKREPSLPVFAALHEQPSISRPLQVLYSGCPVLTPFVHLLMASLRPFYEGEYRISFEKNIKTETKQI